MCNNCRKFLSFSPSPQTIVKRFDFRQLHEPTAFISRDQSGPGRKSGFTRVVVVREDYAGHVRGNPVFHAFQVIIH